jgi:hypothetical protein
METNNSKYLCGYGWHMHLKQLAAYCKKLHLEGYSNQQIRLITKMSSSSISRIVNNQTYQDIGEHDFVRSDVFEDRLHVLNTLLECHEITGGIGLDENNKIYIQILKRVGANFDKVKQLYYDIGKKALRNAWTYPSGNIKDFDGKQLNITVEEIMDLLSEEKET